MSFLSKNTSAEVFGREEPFIKKPFFTELFLIVWRKIYGLDNNENIDYIPKVAKVILWRK